MKLSTTFLTLLSLSSTLAIHLRYDGECGKDHEKLFNCTLSSEAFFSEECQDYFKNPLTKLPHCNKELDEDSKRVHIAKTKELEAYSIKLFSKDENGNDCPLNNSEQIFDKESKDILAETCKSKKCTEAAIKAYTLFSEATKELREFQLYTTDYFDQVSEAFIKCSKGEAPGKIIEYKSKEVHPKKQRKCIVKKNKN